MNAYIYQADLWCEECIKKIKDQLHAENRAPAEPGAETTYDSDDYPKGPYSDGGGESDSPQNCAGCHVFLENDLTSEGIESVIQAGIEEVKDGRDKFNRIMPAKGTGEDDDSFKRWHGQPHKAIVLEWLEHIRTYNLDSGDTARVALLIELLT